MSFLVLPPLLITLQIPLLHVNNILALAITPRHQALRVGVSLPVLVLLVSQSLYREWDATWGMHYALNCAVLGTACIYIDWILLASPDKEGWYKIQYGKEEEEKTRNGGVDGAVKEKKKESVPQGFWERVWWGIRLATTIRYVGWSNEVKNVPIEVSRSYSRVYVVQLFNEVPLVITEHLISS